jgi:hypothetical protein
MPKPKEDVPAKFVQIAVATSETVNDVVFALDEDGVVWRHEVFGDEECWQPLPMDREDEEEEVGE